MDVGRQIISSNSLKELYQFSLHIPNITMLRIKYLCKIYTWQYMLSWIWSIYMTFMLKIFSPRNKILAPIIVAVSSIHLVHVRSHQGGSVLIIFLWYVAPTTWPPWFLSQSYIPSNKSSASCATYATPLLSTSKFFLRLQVIHCDLWTSPTVSLTAAPNMHGWAARQHARFSSRMYRDKRMLGAHDDAKIALLSQLLALASRA